MPWFPELNTVLVHIPKTGGTSIERYLYERSYPNSTTNWYDGMQEDPKFLFDPKVLHSPQHYTYQEILRAIGKNENQMDRILVTVRNPYHRVLSDLLWQHRQLDTADHVLDSINARSCDVVTAQIAIENSVKRYIENFAKDPYANDNHALPQWRFVEGLHLNNPNVCILRTETLQADMHRAGYHDFQLHENGHSSGYKYDELLTPRSKQLISEAYAKDFRLFGYTNYMWAF